MIDDASNWKVLNASYPDLYYMITDKRIYFKGKAYGNNIQTSIAIPTDIKTKLNGKTYAVQCSAESLGDGARAHVDSNYFSYGTVSTTGNITFNSWIDL